MQMGTRRWDLMLVLLALISTAIAPAAFVTPAMAIEVGEPAPDFRLPSTFGNDISLGDYRGKKWVLLEFYGADFAPT
jgi:hypothetical protein